MNKLSIRYLFPEDPDALSLFESLNELEEAIRQRAFGLFSERGTIHGNDMEDWLRAERELVWMPQSETMEDDKQPAGADCARTRSAGSSNHGDARCDHRSGGRRFQRGQGSQTVPFRELRGRKLFRRFDFEEPIDP